MIVFLPIAGFFGYNMYGYMTKKLVYDEASKDEKPGDGPKNGGKSWYQISKVRGTEGSYQLLGVEFQSPRMIFINGVRGYMGGVIKEVLADEKVNKQGLDFLDRAFRHPQTHEAGQFLLINVLKDHRFIDASKIFGTDLIAHVILQDAAQEEFKKLIVKTLADERV